MHPGPASIREQRRLALQVARRGFGAVSYRHLNSDRAVYPMLTPLYTGPRSGQLSWMIFSGNCWPTTAMITSRFERSRDLAAQEYRQRSANIGVAKRRERCVRVLRSRHSPADGERGKDDAR